MHPTRPSLLKKIKTISSTLTTVIGAIGACITALIFCTTIMNTYYTVGNTSTELHAFIGEQNKTHAHIDQSLSGISNDLKSIEKKLDSETRVANADSNK